MTTPDSATPTPDEADSGERMRRDEPTRTAPNRQTANVLLPGSETVDAAVKLAYKVLGSYLERGVEAAKQQAEQGERKNPWVFPTASLPAGLTAIPLQMFRAWAQLAGSWAELSMMPGAAEGVRQMTKLVEDFWAMAGVSNGDADGKPDGEAEGAAKRSRAAIRCVVEVASTQPVEVDVEFDPPAGVVPLIQRLHPLRGEAPPLTGFEFSYDATSGRARLQLAVPPAQEPGRYVGTIFDDRDDRACGTIRVRVGDG